MKKIIQKISGSVIKNFSLRERECGKRPDSSEPAEMENSPDSPEPAEMEKTPDSPEPADMENSLDLSELADEEDTLDPADNGCEKIAPESADAGHCGEKREIQAVVVNHKGRVRGNNEDNFCLNGAYMKREEMDGGAFLETNCRDAVQLYAVCDGMGGAECGEEASYLAVKELSAGKALLSSMAGTEELTSLIRKISGKIYREARQKGRKSGTTIALMLVNHGRVLFANVGDSRIYHFREGKLSQVSMDHSKVQRMISMGILTAEQARTDPDRHVITQYLGMPPEIRVSPYFASNRELRQGDVCLLCSDGLTDMVGEERMEEILRENEKLPEAARMLLNEALKNGGRDNITVLLVRAASEKE